LNTNIQDVKANNYDVSTCDIGCNSEAKQPEHVFINLFTEENRNSPNVDVDSQAQSQIQWRLDFSIGGKIKYI
jgi:hypothetical protein